MEGEKTDQCDSKLLFIQLLKKRKREILIYNSFIYGLSGNYTKMRDEMRIYPITEGSKIKNINWKPKALVYKLGRNYPRFSSL